MGNNGYLQYKQCTNAGAEERNRRQMKHGQRLLSFAGNAGINSYRPRLPCFMN